MSMPISQLPEWFAAQQRKHYAMVLANFISEMQLSLSDHVRQALIQRVQATLDADLARCVKEATELVAHGLRSEDEALH